VARYNYSRLSVQDNDFLLWETPSLAMHVSGIQIFEAGPLRNEDGGIDFAMIRRATESVLHRIPRYRQKIHWIPGYDRAVWVDDPHFNIDYHLRHISLPRPGTDAQLKRFTSRIMEVQLDRSRPLWETWVVEGLEGDRFALIAKTHHCMVDGASGMGVASLLFAGEPTSEILDAPRFVPRPIPSDRVLRRDERLRNLSAPVRAFGQLRDFVNRSDDIRAVVKERASAVAQMAQYKLHAASDTPLNGPVGPHRIFESTDVPLAAVKAIGKTLGVSINDVLLGIVTGAVRSFLTGRSTPVASLDFRVSTPVNVRTEKDNGRLGNRVSSWIVPLPLRLADPIEQVRAIHETTQELKRSRQETVVDLVNTIHEWFPFDIQAASRGTQNMTVSNVPGPQQPLYLLGAKLLGMYPQGPLIDNVGLVVAAISYNGKMCFGFNADQDRVPDLADFRKAIEHALQNLHQATKVPLDPKVKAIQIESPHLVTSTKHIGAATGA
jgi:diacylglycerol O-acyltransferase